jgi:hypothetical protein
MLIRLRPVSPFEFCAVAPTEQRAICGAFQRREADRSLWRVGRQRPPVHESRKSLGKPIKKVKRHRKRHSGIGIMVSQVKS